MFRRFLPVAIVTAVAVLGGTIPAAAQTATARPVDTPLCLTVRAAPDVDLENPVVVQTQIATGAIEVTDVVPCDGAAAPTAAPPTGDTGAWIVGEIETDPMSDMPTTSTFIYSESGTNSSGEGIVFAIRCRDAETSAIAVWGDYMGSDDYVSVDTRIDDGPVESDLWGMSDTNNAAFYQGDAIALVRQLIDGDRLVIRAIPFGESAITAVFDLAGLDNALVNVREACGW